MLIFDKIYQNEKKELELIVTISIAIAIILGVAYIVALDKTFNIKDGVRAVSFGISATTLFWTFYFSYGWKTWGLKKIFYRPNLNGTWAGILKSDWKDENGNSPNDIEFYIVIRQSFLRIHFTTFTNSFIGISYSETLSLEKEIGLKNVAYLYRKDTSQYDDKLLQEGATELRIIDSNERKLVGKYWSNRKTNGKIEVSFLSKQKVDSFADAKNMKNNG